MKEIEKENIKKELLDIEYDNLNDEKQDLVIQTANDIMELDGINLKIKSIANSMYRTLYKYKSMEELKKFNLI